jgi:hypothetical protein
MHADCLTLANLRGVMNKTWKARSKWKEIGIQLKLEKIDLDAISNTNGSDVDACFTEMLSMWLKQTKSQPKWSRMIKALKSRPVGFQQLAEHIGMNSGTKKRDKLLQLPLKGTVDSVTDPTSENPHTEGVSGITSTVADIDFPNVEVHVSREVSAVNPVNNTSETDSPAAAGVNETRDTRDVRSETGESTCSEEKSPIRNIRG